MISNEFAFFKSVKSEDGRGAYIVSVPAFTVHKQILEFFPGTHYEDRDNGTLRNRGNDSHEVQSQMIY